MNKNKTVPNYPVVIFDMDGLMIDSELLQSLSFKAVLKKHGVIVKEKIVQVLGVRVIENLEIMKKKFGIKEEVATLFQEKNEIYHRLLEKGIKPMTGLFSLVKLLSKNNFRMALSSSSNYDAIRLILKKLKMASYFEVVFSGDQVKKGKPDPEIYLKTAEKLKANSEQCLVLEDAQTGVNSAKDAGMKCIAVPNIYTKNQDFLKADLKVKSLMEINIKTIFRVMGEEYLDIVDKQDKLIGRDTRKKVHDDFSIHRGVHVLILNAKGELLLQKRSLNKDYYPGFFDISVGAQVAACESYLESAFRETKEELGFQPQKLIKICDYQSYSTRQKENRRLFFCRFKGPFEIDKNEVEFIKFFPPETIKKEIESNKKQFTEGFKISFDRYLKFVNAKK